jgi:hypothetical protein
MRLTTVAVFAVSLVLTTVDAARVPANPKFPDPRLEFAVTASNSTEATGCEACCGGGNCSDAFRGTPGICCGVIDGRSFCCPNAASSFGEAQCYQPDATSFRCRAAGSSESRHRPFHRPSPWYALFSLLIPIALLAACCVMCFRKPQQQQPNPVVQPYYNQSAQPRGAAYGYPVSQPHYQSYQNQPQGGGYGASNLAGAGTSPRPPPPSFSPSLPTSDPRAPSAPPLTPTKYYPTT